MSALQKNPVTPTTDAARWHLARRRRRKRIWIGILLSPVVVLCVLVIWFGFRLLDKPAITRNFTAEFNERIAEIPEQDRAWPIYKQAMIAKSSLERPAELFDDWPVYPGWDDWESAKGWIQQATPMLDLVREGAHKPKLGKTLSDAQDPDLVKALGIPAYGSGSENPMMIAILLPELGWLRGFSADLVVDTQIAAQAGRGGRVVENIEAIMGLARHAAESETIIGQLVRTAIQNRAVETALRIMHEYPELLTSDQLERMQSIVAPGGVGGLEEARARGDSLHLSMERAFFEDIVQRTYSDDGHGSGHMTLEGARLLQEDVLGLVTGNTGQKQLSAVGLVLFSATRRNTANRYASLMDKYENAARIEPWERKGRLSEIESQYLQFRQQPLARFRYAVFDALVPSLDKAIRHFDRNRTRKEGAALAIALERYRMAVGEYPAELSKLVPGYIDAIPRDPVDGKPLRYRLVAEGPVIYSLGADEDDDSGTMPVPEANSTRIRVEPWMSDADDGDWVIYPIGPAEQPKDE